MNAQEFWNAVISKYAAESLMDVHMKETWLDSLTAASYEKDELTLAAPSEAKRIIATYRYAEGLGRCASEIAGKQTKVQIVCAPARGSSS